MPQFPADSNPLAPDCQRCPELTESRECIAWGNGPMAYTSRHSGRRIRELLADCGYGHDDCYFTNAVRCFPSDPDDPTIIRHQSGMRPSVRDLCDWPSESQP